MAPPKRIEKAIKQLQDHTPTELDEKILSDAVTTMQMRERQPAAASGRLIWRTIMTSKASKYAAAAIIAVSALAFILFDNLSQPAWALEQAVEALRNFGAIHIVGAFPSGKAEIWMRANEAKTHSTDVIVKGSHGAITWTRDGSTYTYEPSQNTVYFEDALTVGMAQWFGPDLLEVLGKAENAKVIRGKDPATGRDRATLLCSINDVSGPHSWVIEFDVASKLPVGFKKWQNLDRHGRPSFAAIKITYYEDLPDSVFDVRIPSGAKHVEKALKIPDETVGILSNPQDGISAEGMTQQEAAERAVRTMYQAVIEQDLDQLKSICPLCRNWGDEFLRTIILMPDRDDRIVEILEIRQISGTGRSALGPIVAIPTVFRRANGTKAAQKMIVQFRQLGDESSCVVHGPYGLPHEIE